VRSLPEASKTPAAKRDGEAEWDHSLEHFQPSGEVPGEIGHDRLALGFKVGIITVGFPGGLVHQVGDGPQDQAGDLVAPGDPGDRAGLPIGDGCVEAAHQLGHLGREDVPVGGEDRPDGDRLGRRIREPGQVELDRVVVDGGSGIRHAFNDVVDEGLAGQEHLAPLRIACKPAAGAQVDHPGGCPAVDGVLCGCGCGHLAPAAVQKGNGIPADGRCEGLAVGGGENIRLGEVGQERAPLRPGGDQYTRIDFMGGHPLRVFCPGRPCRSRTSRAG
jgi:hypothetical protein